MAVEIRVPPLGESVVEATVGRWTKEAGDTVRKDEVLVELETDKITVEVAAPADGRVGEIAHAEGDTVGVNDVLGTLEPGEVPEAEPAAVGAAAEGDADAALKERSAGRDGGDGGVETRATEAQISPAARAIAGEHGIAISEVEGSGPNGRITKQDVLRIADERMQSRQAPSAPAAPAPKSSPAETGEREERQRMSRRRQTIARRLVEAQQTTASLTTFNEVDLSRVMQIRKRHQEEFVAKHDVKLGFMSFFTKAAIAALKEFPRLNAELDGDGIVLKYHYDIGIAVGAEEGLVVPVLRDADRMSFAELEQQIGELGRRAREGKLTLEDLQGGTFTITNGGVFGSMLSTPILNPPQVGILGMHNIVQRPVALDGEVVIRPIMYVALTYDHRIVDGSEAVQFLVFIKRMLENPERMLIDG
jgi:2-oxoglutarate dehydrogenase E2 component (dihydrolipoamide succinyltransferase)